MGHRLLFRALRRSMTACFQGVSARLCDFSRFIIGLTTSIAFSVQAANIDEYIKQLPAGANLALMVQKDWRARAGY